MNSIRRFSWHGDQRRLAVRWRAALTGVGGAATLLLCGAESGAVSCPSGGAKVRVCVTNYTAQTPSVTVSGTVVSPGLTCTGPPPIAATYSATLMLNPNGMTCTTSPFPATGVMSGLFVHRINVPSTTQNQYLKKPVMYDSTTPTQIDWAYYPSVFTVSTAGDSGSGSCPVNSTSSTTCDVRSAITAAGAVSGSDGVLIQFTASPGAVNNDLTISRTFINPGVGERNIVLDGTDANGNPWIVGDANAAAAGSQSSFPRSVVFPRFSGFHINALMVTLQGLEIKQDTSSGGPLANLVELGTDQYGVQIVRSRLDAQMAQHCSDITNDCGEPYDLVRVPPGTSPDPPEPDVTLLNVEARSAVDRAVDLFSKTTGTIEDSWIHNNYQGNVRANTASGLTIVNSTIERAGLRASDDRQMDIAASGVFASHGGTSFPFSAFVNSSGTIYRNNVKHGIEGTGLSTDLGLVDDYVCGNGSHGILTSNGGIPSGPPDVLGSGMTAAYNSGNGVRATLAGSSVVTIEPASSFTANTQCGLYNASGGTSISARFDQWSDSGPTFADQCSGTAPGSVDTTLSKSPTIDPPFVFATAPTKALILGQTIRVEGVEFNSIAGNPPAGDAGCDTGINTSGSQVGQPNSCCKKTARSNTCTAVNTPGVGNCVEVRDRAAIWTTLGVRAATPRLIETSVPAAVLGCIGGQGEKVRVSKKDSTNTTVFGETPYCLN